MCCLSGELGQGFSLLLFPDVSVVFLERCILASDVAKGHFWEGEGLSPVSLFLITLLLF